MRIVRLRSRGHVPQSDTLSPARQRPRQGRRGAIPVASSRRTLPSQPRASAHSRALACGRLGEPELLPQEFFFERIAVGRHGRIAHIRVL
jgi:hypothetical protein